MLKVALIACLCAGVAIGAPVNGSTANNGTANRASPMNALLGARAPPMGIAVGEPYGNFGNATGLPFQPMPGNWSDLFNNITMLPFKPMPGVMNGTLNALPFKPMPPVMKPMPPMDRPDFLNRDDSMEDFWSDGPMMGGGMGRGKWHGGMGGGMMGGMKGGKKCQAAVGPKVGACLKAATKSVDVFIVWSNKQIDNMLNEMVNDWDAEDDHEEEMKKMAKEILAGKQAPMIKQFINAKMASDVAKFIDDLFEDMPEALTNVAWGTGKDWQYVNGAEEKKANWTAFEQEMMKTMDWQGLMDIFAKFHGGMGGGPGFSGPGFGGEDGNNWEVGGPMFGGDIMPAVMPAVMPPPRQAAPSTKKPKQAPNSGAKPAMVASGKPERQTFDNILVDPNMPIDMMPPAKPPMHGMKKHLKSKLADNFKWGVMQEIAGKKSPFGTTRKSDKPGLVIVVTAEDFDPSILPGGKADFIIDVMGRYTNQTSHANNAGLEENILIAGNPKDCKSFMPTLRFRACQRNGGVSKVQPPKPPKPVRNQTVSSDGTFRNDRENVVMSSVGGPAGGKPAVLPAKPPVKPAKPIKIPASLAPPKSTDDLAKNSKGETRKPLDILVNRATAKGSSNKPTQKPNGTKPPGTTKPRSDGTKPPGTQSNATNKPREESRPPSATTPKPQGY